MFLQAERYHHRVKDGGGHGTPGKPANVIRRSQSLAALVQPVQSLVRSPFDTIGSIAGSLGQSAGLLQTPVERDRSIALLRLQGAKTYEEWQAAATRLDELEGAEEWKAKDECEDYDVDFVKDRLASLQAANQRGDVADLRWQCRTSLTRSLGEFGNVELYKHSRTGTKQLIEEYICTATTSIERVVLEAGEEYQGTKQAKDLCQEMKLIRQAFGRSALLLSGGGTFGMNHIGVVKALWEADLLPRIISGASAGSIVCAVLCTKRDHEVPQMLEDFCTGELDVFESEAEKSSPLKKLLKFVRKGIIYDIGNLERVMKSLIGNMTFLDAYNKTQRILNICVSTADMNDAGKILNYVTSPDVVIWSAVSASCSVPGIYNPACLFERKPGSIDVTKLDDSASGYIDGSIDNDLPITRLAEQFNVNHFIVSQVNPHVIPFLIVDDNDKPADTQHASVCRPAPGWFNGVAGYARGEALHRLHALTELGVMPNALTKVRSILGQRYSGDITILPEISYLQFPNVLTNPSPEFMRHALINGERATWPKLSRIRNHLVVEMKLDWAVRRTMAASVFSPEQLEARTAQFGQAAVDRTDRGRPRRSSRSSHNSVRSMIISRQRSSRRRQETPGLRTARPPAPTIITSEAGPSTVDYPSSTDEALSATSASPTPVTDDEYDSSDEDSETSLSPGSPHEGDRPTTRQLFPSASQPATPSITYRSFLSGSPTSPQSLRPRPTNLTMTPTEDNKHITPETQSEEVIHRNDSPLQMSRSQARPLPPGASEGSAEQRPETPRKAGKSGLRIKLFGNRRSENRSSSTGMRDLLPPPKR
ncbi:Lipase 5 [Recurvomyces mirabilis]|nr:Lipase 5 [Recurvomyces mirabilis]